MDFPRYTGISLTAPFAANHASIKLCRQNPLTTSVPFSSLWNCTLSRFCLKIVQQRKRQILGGFVPSYKNTCHDISCNINRKAVGLYFAAFCGINLLVYYKLDPKQCLPSYLFGFFDFLVFCYCFILVVMRDATVIGPMGHLQQKLTTRVKLVTAYAVIKVIFVCQTTSVMDLGLVW